MEEELIEEIIEPKQHDIMRLFETLSFKEKWRRVMAGLKMPPESGAYKYAKLQMIRLLAPLAAIVIPIILILLLMVLAVFKAPPPPPTEIRILEPEEIPELEDIEEIIEEPPEPPEPMEIEFTPDVNIDVPTPTPPTDFSPKPAEFDAVAMVKSPVVMKNIYGSRTPGARGQMLSNHGGNSATERAVMRALRWLKVHQNSNGSWNDTAGAAKDPHKGLYSKAKAAFTAMALLTYLAHGETPTADEFGPTVEKAIKFLVQDQTYNGRFKSRDTHDYTHPIAAYALCEAYGLTKIPMLKDAASKAIDFIIKGQHSSGGWDYNCKQSKRDDTSYMGWCAQALKAAKMAGVYEDEGALKGALKKAVKGFQKNSNSGGGFGYVSPDPPTGLTGVGILCMQLLGATQYSEVHKGLAWLDKNAAFDWEAKGSPMLSKSVIYYTYYITQAKFQRGGATWKIWNKQFSSALVKNQVIISAKESGYEDTKGKPQDIGYWDSPSKMEHTGGRVGTTCLCALQLQVYYRYLPTFQAPKKPDEEKEDLSSKDDIKVNIGVM